MNRVKILLVEDDPSHQLLLTMSILECSPDAQLITATNRREFRDRIRSDRFDCVVFDYNLADCQADTLLLELAELHPDCPAVVISSSSEQSVAVLSFRNGGLDFIPKDEAIGGPALWQRIEKILLEKQHERRARRKRARRKRQLIQLAETDALTGLPNRWYLARMLRRNGRKVYDRRGRVCTILLDLDHFKRINDAHGHLCGDRVLRRVAEILRAHCGPDDVVCRWGGEEFVALRVGATLADGVCWIERVRDALREATIEFGGETIRVTASAGIVESESNRVSESLLGRADQALYAAKAQGRDRVCTDRCVLFERLLAKISARDAEQRLAELLVFAKDELGPVQTEHLTNHADEVSEVAVQIARAMGVDRVTLRRIRLAGRFHDLGKLMVPEDVLAKPHALTAAERLLMTRHARDGAEMARRLGLDEETCEYIRDHHARVEECDEDALSLGARILSVADAYVTQISYRPYRDAQARSGALHELRRHRGTQFDSVVVDVAIRTLSRRALAVPKLQAESARNAVRNSLGVSIGAVME